MPRVTKKTDKSTTGFARRLKQLRLQKEMSQQGVADRIGIHITNYGSYERDDSNPSTDTLKKLADVFEVSADYLLEGKEEDAAIANMEDQELLKMFTEVERFSPEVKDKIKFLIKAVIKSEKHEQVAAS